MVIDEVILAGVLIPLAVAAVEIRHKKSEDVILVRVEGETLEGATLAFSYLRGADLRYSNLAGADLTNTDLREADFFGADLSEANLTGANLRGADFSAANLDGCKLDGARYNRLTRWPDGFDPKNAISNGE